MSTGAAQPATYSVPPAVVRRGFPRLQDVGIRSKLVLILIVPLAAVLALATVRLVDVGGRALAAVQVEELTRLYTDVSDLTQVLHEERMAAARHLADPNADKETYAAAIAQTDSAIQRYDGARRGLESPPESIEERLVRIDNQLRTMGATRDRVVDRDRIAATEAVTRYGAVITDLVAYGDVLSRLEADGKVADGLRALSAFTRAKAGTAEQEAITFATLASGDVSAGQRSALIATQMSRQDAIRAFSRVATPAQRTLVDSTVTGDAVKLADQVATRLGRGGAVAPAEITRSLGAVVDLMRRAEQRLEQQSVAAAADQSRSVTRQATVESILVLIVLIVAVVVAVVLARSLNISLRRLREGALAVANRDLPDAVARLRDVRNLGDGGADDIVRQVSDPIQLRNRDEVGQVAQAFNVVHREAVRVAAEQAALRTSVSTMFLSLARRSQALVDRMIGELDQIERSEEDPKRLARLFELDHLATRMRRNDENLLVLAGADPGAPRREDALLVDALRAAQSEVELYNRIEFGTVDTDVSIAALAVNDVVRLLAELFDNATRFSPPETVVVADGRRIRDYVVIQVEDRGLGMSAEQMDLLNRRLAEPPTVDVAAFRLMGIAVVGRLASRYGIRVELRVNIEGGTVAQVILPSSIVVLPNRSIELPGPRTRQLDSVPSSGWDALPAGRSAPASLPAAMVPEPAPAGPAELPRLPSRRRSQPDAPSPALDRPSLPGRATAPVTPVPTAQPALAVPAAGATIGSPTETYPTVQPASPDSQIAADFVTPNGRTNPPAPLPASPNPPGWGAALAAMPPPPPPPAPPPVEERVEAPIFLQMQASWFERHDGVSNQDWTMPTAGYAPPPAPQSHPTPGGEAQPSAAAADPPQRPPRAPVSLSPPSKGGSAGLSGQNGVRPATAGPDLGGTPAPRPRTPADDPWRTAADEGWQRAMAASEPPDAGTTRSGLPKRVPQAQLVPGGVEGRSRNQNRRSPDEVRGLLSAYHRGVQRGRTAGSAASAPKENEK